MLIHSNQILQTEYMGLVKREKRELRKRAEKGIVIEQLAKGWSNRYNF